LISVTGWCRTRCAEAWCAGVPFAALRSATGGDVLFQSETRNHGNSGLGGVRLARRYADAPTTERGNERHGEGLAAGHRCVAFPQKLFWQLPAPSQARSASDPSVPSVFPRLRVRLLLPFAVAGGCCRSLLPFAVAVRRYGGIQCVGRGHGLCTRLRDRLLQPTFMTRPQRQELPCMLCVSSVAGRRRSRLIAAVAHVESHR